MKTNPFTLLTPVYPLALACHCWRLFIPNGTRLSLLTFVYPYWHPFAPADPCSLPTDFLLPPARWHLFIPTDAFNPNWHSFAPIIRSDWIIKQTTARRQPEFFSPVFTAPNPPFCPVSHAKSTVSQVQWREGCDSPNACVFHQHEYTNIIHAFQRSWQSGIITWNWGCSCRISLYHVRNK